MCVGVGVGVAQVSEVPGLGYKIDLYLCECEDEDWRHNLKALMPGD